MSYFISINLTSFGNILTGPQQHGRCQILSSSTNYCTKSTDFGGVSRADALIEISKLLTKLNVEAVPCAVGDGVSAAEAAIINRVNTRTILDSLCNAALQIRGLDDTKPVVFSYGVSTGGKIIIEIEVKEQDK